MNAVTAGAGIALLVAGWPLYQLVTSGDLDATSALIRGAVVAGACAVGVTGVVRLAIGYEQQIQRDRTRKLDSLFTEMDAAAADGTLKDAPPPAGGARAEGGKPAV